jgi:aconitate hydratase
MPAAGACDYSEVVEIDLAEVVAGISGPKRPQDRIDLADAGRSWAELLTAPLPQGYGLPPDERIRVVSTRVGATNRAPERGPLAARGGGDQREGPMSRDTSALTELEMMNNRPTPDVVETTHDTHVPVAIGHGSVVIAAITSCTNTSNPAVMIEAGLLARNAAMKGLRPKPYVKTSLAPGSRAVTDYLDRLGLLKHLEALGFGVVAYGCTTCIGNSGPLDPHVERAVERNALIAASVLSGNRNFEARIHHAVRANFLMSPALVIAFALAGRIDLDLRRDPIGRDQAGRDVWLRDIWPSRADVDSLLATISDPSSYRRLYSDARMALPKWRDIPAPEGLLFDWDPSSTYIREPPFFGSFSMEPDQLSDIDGARAIALFGDSVTTDHISPAGAIAPGSPAARYLQDLEVGVPDFNSYGARRGNHEVMMRGTFANVRIRNLMARGAEGGVTTHHPSGDRMAIYDACMRYASERVPVVVLAGHEYGSGSSRDWAAKGPRLLGVRAVVARSFERIHRSNLVGMGVLPCQFPDGESAATLGLDGSEVYDLRETAALDRPLPTARLVIHRRDGTAVEVSVSLRIETPIEVDYVRHGGLLPYTLRHLMRRSAPR